MTRTAKQIQGDIYNLLKTSIIADEISGGVYRSGYRPRDSQAEDAVVIFTSGLTNQIQTGVITVHVYIPDIDPYDNGVMVENGARAETLETLAQQWVDGLTTAVSSYRFRLQQTICTEAAEEINQHYIVIALKYEYYDGTN